MHANLLVSSKNPYEIYRQRGYEEKRRRWGEGERKSGIRSERSLYIINSSLHTESLVRNDIPPIPPYEIRRFIQNENGWVNCTQNRINRRIDAVF